MMSTTKRQRGGTPRGGPAAAAAVAAPPLPSAACATGSFHARPTSAAAGLLDSDDEDSITEKVMQLLEEEVQRGLESDCEAEDTPKETENAIAPEPLLVSVPRPLVAGTKTIEILWKAGIPPFMLPADKWEVADWSCITVYEWRGEEGSHGGLCRVGHHPHRHLPVRTAWRVVPRVGRRGRSRVSTVVLYLSHVAACFVLSSGLNNWVPPRQFSHNSFSTHPLLDRPPHSGHDSVSTCINSISESKAQAPNCQYECFWGSQERPYLRFFSC